jgi:hypothetical protein
MFSLGSLLSFLGIALTKFGSFIFGMVQARFEETEIMTDLGRPKSGVYFAFIDWPDEQIEKRSRRNRCLCLKCPPCFSSY